MEIKEAIEIHSSPPLISSTRWWSKDTVAIVTGANKGIGFSIVKEFAEKGLTVVLTARSLERGRQAVNKLLGGHHHHHLHNLHFHALDVSDPASINTFVLWFKQRFGVLDILVNNAAVSFNELYENSVEHSETVIKTNFYGPKLLIEALLPMFRSSDSITRILNISSRLGSFIKLKNPKLRKMVESEGLNEEQIEGMVRLFLENVKDGTWKSGGWPEVWTDYAVSKLALNAYSRVLAKRFKDCGSMISVNCFCPGFTQTSMTRGKGKYTADDVAQIGVRLALLPPQQLPTGVFFNPTPTTSSKL